MSESFSKVADIAGESQTGMHVLFQSFQMWGRDGVFKRYRVKPSRSELTHFGHVMQFKEKFFWHLLPQNDLTPGNYKSRTEKKLFQFQYFLFVCLGFCFEIQVKDGMKMSVFDLKP